MHDLEPGSFPFMFSRIHFWAVGAAQLRSVKVERHRFGQVLRLEWSRSMGSYEEG